MTQVRVVRGENWEATDLPIWLRFVNEDGSALLKAQIDDAGNGWDWYLFDLSSNTPTVAAASATGLLSSATNNDGSDIWYDTIAVRAGFTDDDVGINFYFVMPADTYSIVAKRSYKLEVVVHRVDGPGGPLGPLVGVGIVAAKSRGSV